jgi:hypothetical protein
VAATTDTIQSAMRDFRANASSAAGEEGDATLGLLRLTNELSVSASHTGTTLFHGGGPESYPLSFLHYLILNQSRFTEDCYTVEQNLVFLSWTQYDGTPPGMTTRPWC